MLEFWSSTAMALAILLGALYGCFTLWKKGKLRWARFLPAPPSSTTNPPETKP